MFGISNFILVIRSVFNSNNLSSSFIGHKLFVQSSSPRPLILKQTSSTVATISFSLPTAKPEITVSEKSPKWSARAIKSFGLGVLDARKLRYSKTGTECLIMGILTEGICERGRFCLAAIQILNLKTAISGLHIHLGGICALSVVLFFRFEKFRIVMLVSQAAINFIQGITYSPPEEVKVAGFKICPHELGSIVEGRNLKKLKGHGGVEGVAEKLSTCTTKGISCTRS